MKKFLSILMVVFLIMTVVSCGEKASKETPEEILKRLGLDIEDASKITVELSQKGLAVSSFYIGERAGYVVGLYKLNQLTEEEIEQIREELKSITIAIDDRFSKTANNYRGILVIDYRASITEIKSYILENVLFVYNERLEEVKAFNDGLSIAKTIVVQFPEGSHIYRNPFISWREALVGLKKLSCIFIKEAQKINQANIQIVIDEEFRVEERSGKTWISIDYKASVKEIKEFLHID